MIRFEAPLSRRSMLTKTCAASAENSNKHRSRSCSLALEAERREETASNRSIRRDAAASSSTAEPNRAGLHSRICWPKPSKNAPAMGNGGRAGGSDSLRKAVRTHTFGGKSGLKNLHREVVPHLARLTT
eukprot:7357023-Alexandrium_andersonii.AAC.1